MTAKTKQFNLNGDYIELTKLLKATGLCQTGGHAKVMVSEGLVTVDGEIETRKKKKIRSGQIVAVDTVQIRIV